MFAREQKHVGFLLKTNNQTENVFAQKVACANKIEFLYEKLNTYSTLHIKYAQTYIAVFTSNVRVGKHHGKKLETSTQHSFSNGDGFSTFRAPPRILVQGDTKPSPSTRWFGLHPNSGPS